MNLKQYEDRMPLYKEFVRLVEDKLYSILKLSAPELKLQTISNRVKSLESLRDRLSENGMLDLDPGHTIVRKSDFKLSF